MYDIKVNRNCELYKEGRALTPVFGPSRKPKIKRHFTTLSPMKYKHLGHSSNKTIQTVCCKVTFNFSPCLMHVLLHKRLPALSFRGMKGYAS